jgi:hypothetical protein
LDKSLEADCDYSDLFLWMVDEIARQFKERGHPVDDAALAKVTEWFAEKAYTQTSEWMKEIGLTAEAQASSRAGIPGIFSFKLLARLKSMIVGSEKSRREIRQKVQNYASELRERMNEFLDGARVVLRKAGKPDRLLIVQDNLDRLRPREMAQRFFDNGAEMLLDIRADVIYTAPLALNLAPLNISRVFPHVFTMPNVKVRTIKEELHKPGIDGLIELVGKRLALGAIFENGEVPRYIVELSGGSVRDLIRLLDDAQLLAQVDEKTRIDMASARAAVRKLAVTFTRLLIPGSVYYPILAEIHRTKQEFRIAEGEATRERAAAARDFFADLIGMGSVLEYNGAESWYDVHPALLETEEFKHALARAKSD